MFRAMTYRKKFRLVLYGFVIIVLMSWWLAFSETFSLASTCSSLEEQLGLIQNAPEQISQIQLQLSKIEKDVGQSQLSGDDFQKALLDHISIFCREQGTVLREMPMMMAYSNSNFRVETYPVVVEGTFLKLLRLLYSLEQQQRIGRLISVHFETRKDYKTNIVYLGMTMYFQNIIPLDDESI